ncbi:protein toll-like isoform X2 [Pectinophora gossypiella]|uniref:protein toll-like isoform X2 n=1 Tax=Pectinophora gossypiella TaxID=13191 RepID=UPI00214F1EFD|nr:protein toll-like isoform X2 [Pectinophora gossypiella]
MVGVIQTICLFIFILVSISGQNIREDEKAPDNTHCPKLHTLKIKTSDLRRVSSGWLEPCKVLQKVVISRLRQRNGTKEIRRKVFSGAKSIRHLAIHYCYIEELNDEIADLVNLQTMDVSHNQIHYALTTIVLPSLLELDLSHNHIFSSALLATGVEKQPNLRYLTLDYNAVLDICDTLNYRTTIDDIEPKWHEPLSGRTLELRQIRRFSLRGTITTQMCFGNMIMDSLEYFDLSDSKIRSIHFLALPISKQRHLEINVTGCPITDIPSESFTEDNYKMLRYDELRITGLNIVLDCSCDTHLWLARAARERKLVLHGVRCGSGVDLAATSEDQFSCSRHECGPCQCTTHWKDNLTDMVCANDLQAIPHYPGLRKLKAAGNAVENVTVEDLPDTLIFLDLSRNHVARMSAEAAAALFTVKERHVRFLGNPIICDCENKPFIQELMDHFDQVDDYTSLTCIDDGRWIKEVNPENLCLASNRVFMTGLLAGLGVLVGLTALLAGGYYRYGQQAKVYLYSRGFCLFCIREDEVDADRNYDAFLSFSHKDEDFITEHLLPTLESEPYGYKICVHYRNWVAGELIPTQINKSVEQSKRTIIVLSKNFMESVWGLLEFRTAHLSALKEGRSRVIIVIIDDILESANLDGELRSYLRTNTYVKWGDQWFWDKLRYALPHRREGAPRVRMTDRSQTITLSHQNLAERTDTASTDSAIEMERYDGPSTSSL